MSPETVIPGLFRPALEIPDSPYDHLLRKAADRFSERPAIIYHNLVLTYREVVSLVNSLANGLSQLGLSKGDHLCVFTTNSPEFPHTVTAL